MRLLDEVLAHARLAPHSWSQHMLLLIVEENMRAARFQNRRVFEYADEVSLVGWCTQS